MALNAPIRICATCGRAIFGQHVCPPSWLVWNEDQGETWEEAELVYADDAEEAAAAWGEQDDNNSAEYDIAKGTPAVVCVQRHRDGPVERYRVHGEYEPRYWAEPVK